MGRKIKHKGGKKKDRREAALAEAAEAVRERGARARLAPELWMDATTPGSPVEGGVATAATVQPSVPRASRSVATAAPARAADEVELAARLASLSTVLQRQLGRADAGEGLTRARLSALALLVLGGPRRLGELAAAERVRPPTMTRLVHAMEADGWVVREPDPADRRSVIIRATPAGESQLEMGRSAQLAPLAASIAALEASERQTLEDGADLLERLLRDPSRSAERPSA